ncbi:MAG TPA: hypothetical protein VM695_10350 [Phycisphaerae bacterium]|nr:hypothetical protein [Phycisphaerae bacterium]HUT61647.1 hypothetical protein [Phycisphaerae bacterium]
MEGRLEHPGEAAGSANDGPDQGPLLDLADRLLPRLEANLPLPVSEQIAAWQAYYDGCAPDLPSRLYTDYGQIEGGWRGIAESRIFPKLPELLPGMKLALANLHKVCPDVCNRATSALGLTRPPLVVAYVGLGNGAGWATTWHGRPAVLVGLENVADLGWQHTDALRGLLGHEIGHLLMMQVRGGIESLTEDPLLALYEEGFAQHCEHVVMGRESWHCSSQAGWIDWCAAHEAELARMYLNAMSDREEWRRFFGSWFDVEGWRQTGYFLGCRFAQRECRSCSLAQLASWPKGRIKESVRAFLNDLTDGPAP